MHIHIDINTDILTEQDRNILTLLGALQPTSFSKEASDVHCTGHVDYTRWRLADTPVLTTASPDAEAGALTPAPAKKTRKPRSVPGSDPGAIAAPADPVPAVVAEVRAEMAAEAAAAEAKPEPADDFLAEQQPAGPEVTAEEVRVALVALAKAHTDTSVGQVKAKSIMRDVAGALRFADIDPKKYAAVIKACKEATPA